MKKQSYQKTMKEIADLEEQIAKNQTRQQEAKERLNATRANVQNLEDELRKVLVAGDSKKATTLETKIGKHTDRVILRDKMLLEGLEDELPVLQKKLGEAAERRDQTLGALGAAWLEQEAAAWDRAVTSLVQAGKRLQAARAILQDAGQSETFRQTLGDAASYLTNVKLMSIRDFDRSTLAQSGFRWSFELRDQVKNEICGEV